MDPPPEINLNYGQVFGNEPFMIMLPPDEAVENQPPSPSSIASTTLNTQNDARIMGELQDVKKAICLMQKTLEQQTKALAEQSVKLNTIFDKIFGKPVQEVFKFPIATLEGQNMLDSRLLSESDFEANIKLLIASKIRRKVSANISMIISDELLPEINWNGRKTMQQIGQFRFFQSTLYDCTHQHYNSFEEYEADVKIGIKKGKNRLDQRRHVSKNKKHNINN